MYDSDKATVTFSYTNPVTGQDITVSAQKDWDGTWYELLNDFLPFLRACGFIIPYDHALDLIPVEDLEGNYNESDC